MAHRSRLSHIHDGWERTGRVHRRQTRTASRATAAAVSSRTPGIVASLWCWGAVAILAHGRGSRVAEQRTAGVGGRVWVVLYVGWGGGTRKRWVLSWASGDKAKQSTKLLTTRVQNRDFQRGRAAAGVLKHKRPAVLRPPSTSTVGAGRFPPLERNERTPHRCEPVDPRTACAFWPVAPARHAPSCPALPHRLCVEGWAGVGGGVGLVGPGRETGEKPGTGSGGCAFFCRRVRAVGCWARRGFDSERLAQHRPALPACLQKLPGAARVASA